MRIFYAPEADPVILDSTSGLRASFEAIEGFLKSSESNLTLAARTDGNPAPYEEFLPALQFVKQPGHLSVKRTGSGGIRVQGAPELMQRWIQAFLCSGDQDHRHPEQEFDVDEQVFVKGSLFPYVQADDRYERDGYAFDRHRPLIDTS